MALGQRGKLSTPNGANQQKVWLVCPARGLCTGLGQVASAHLRISEATVRAEVGSAASEAYRGLLGRLNIR